MAGNLASIQIAVKSAFRLCRAPTLDHVGDVGVGGETGFLLVQDLAPRVMVMSVPLLLIALAALFFIIWAQSVVIASLRCRVEMLRAYVARLLRELDKEKEECP
jgi:hypothetical protein